jgi:hypothetical protein
LLKTHKIAISTLRDCLRLVSAALNEISDEWLTCKTYLTFQEPALPAPVPQAQVSLSKDSV